MTASKHKVWITVIAVLGYGGWAFYSSVYDGSMQQNFAVAMRAGFIQGAYSGLLTLINITALEEVDALDFDILIQGHGGPGSKADLVSFIGFLQDLESEVAAAIAAGQSLEEAQESVLLADYSDWLLYEQRRANLVGEMYGILSGG